MVKNNTAKKHSLFILLILACLIFLAGLLLVSYSPFFARETEAAFELNKTRNTPLPKAHIVASGETIYDIARRYSISHYEIVLANRITGEAPLLPGVSLVFPAAPTNTKAATAAGQFGIKATEDRETAPKSTELSVDTDLDAMDVQYVWDLGNNRFSFDKKPIVLYTKPGVYTVRLVLRSIDGIYTVSNSIDITVGRMESYYKGIPYITMDRVGDLLRLDNRFSRGDGTFAHFPKTTQIMQDPALVEFLHDDVLIARAGGFSHVKLKQGRDIYEFYLFVSPIPARLSVEPEYDWYATQFDTGMYGNCGPAGNASAIMWATGKYITVQDVRKEIGMPYANGAVDYDNLREQLSRHGVFSIAAKFSSPETIFEQIDQGKIIIFSFDCGRITRTTGPEETTFTGRYYPDATGHYLLVKGYTIDKKYMVVYDAIPGEWAGNPTRYADGVSMIGRNRFFLTSEVFNAIGTGAGIVVSR
ncbi:MAG: LysM peptidoglycan-binding domain-containing protein [Spirochaetaceae bacterium]|nr:MAG: LysM peptidoglycan-binding domain-containing protein [Spirochaetaceae bacterium]